jgi:mRNA interferase YafQ
MYKIIRTKDFEKSIHRLKRAGKYKKSTKEKLISAIDILAAGNVLPEKYRDHKLKGDLASYRECHIQGDLLLIYQIRDDLCILVLVDIGSHAYIFK